MKWTSEQQEVISTREKNILVSAAAGSGKTAVLTERILQLITDNKHPIDVDELVVVTFTRAAAGEMRERILLSLQKKSDEYLQKVNEGIDIEQNLEQYQYMQKQLSFLHNARITTIDSFCLDVVREHFSMLDLDPAFKIGEEGELTLLRADVMSEVLEKHYEDGNEEFLNFVDVYSTNRSDVQVEELILILYRFAMSYPFPKEWVEDCAKSYDIAGKNMEETPWYQALNQYIESRLLIVQNQIEECVQLTMDADGPVAYQSAVLSDKVFIEAVLSAKDYESRQKFMRNFKAEALSRKKQPDASEEKKELLKSIRDDYKKLIKDISEKYFVKSKDEVIEDIALTAGNAKILADLVLDFMHQYTAAKREKNLVDFNDLEHFVLQILTERKADGSVCPSAVAKAMSEEIAEIMIDEYQDSNYVQEMILTAISGKWQNRHNMFMVGDVKQSIYKFRMAKPELFLEKYNTFERNGDGADRKIILSKNFRSRKQVLDGVNTIFEKIMTKELGGIVYDNANALHYGAAYQGEDSPVEILVADSSEYDEENTELEDDVSSKELEAEMAALRIKELVKEGFLVQDKKTGEKRPVTYSDIVILLRSISGYGEIYEQVFEAHKIPVKCPVKKGCFDAFEVRLILQFLSIIDNPRQDIPLAAVLIHIFDFTEEEIAKIKISFGKQLLYDNLKMICMEEYTKDPDLKGKLQKFFELLQKYRKLKTYFTIYDLIQIILKDTGFEYFVAALPSGSVRVKNLQMLKERAAMYQQSSYSGLFHFIRYIEKNKQYEIEEETMSNADAESAVTIMSIHKSKGLEFPVVMVAAMAKRFNQDDMNKKVVLHSGYGMGLDCYDKEKGTKSVTLIKRSIASQILLENIAEELRVLYVAMTRAKEKLILCGSGAMKRKWQRYEHSYESLKQQERTSFHMNEILSASSYLDWVLMSVGGADVKESGFEVIIKGADELAAQLVKEQTEEKNSYEVFRHWNTDYIFKEEIHNEIENSFAFVYPYQSDITLKAKVSVSDVKHQMMKLYDEESELSEEVSGTLEKEEIIPKFMQDETTKMSVTQKGTAYHRVFELLDYERMESSQDIENQLIEMLEKGFITNEIKQAVRIKDILAFAESDIGQRMKTAANSGKLFREQQFVMKIPATFVNELYQGKESVLVQGIVDAWFEEDGEICLVDYKTDHVKNLQELEERYRIQLIYYGNAVQRITGKKVKELLLYSTVHKKAWKIKNIKGLEKIDSIK